MSRIFHRTVRELAAKFAEQVLHAIETKAPLGRLTEKRRGGAARGATARRTKRASSVSPAKANGASTRLARRSPEQIVAAVADIVALLKKHPQGLRSEQIRAELGLLAKEMPRPIEAGLAAKRITRKGEKRATTYFAR